MLCQAPSAIAFGPASYNADKDSSFMNDDEDEALQAILLASLADASQNDSESATGTGTNAAQVALFNAAVKPPLWDWKKLEKEKPPKLPRHASDCLSKNRKRL